MPIDLQSVVYGAIYTRQAAGATAYNAAITAGTLTGCQKVAPLQAMDDRTDARVRSGLAASAPAGYPRIRLQLNGSDEPKLAATFGQGAGATCDAIQPITLTLIETITHDSIANAAQTPFESYVDAAVRAAPFPSLGLTDSQGRRYVATVGITSTRKDEKIDGAMRTVRRRTLRVGLRIHLSELQ